MKCKKCNQELATDAKFCMFCGTAVNTKVICPQCKQELPSVAQFCMNCGTAIHKENSSVSVQPTIAPVIPAPAAPVPTPDPTSVATPEPWINKAIRNTGADQFVQKTGLNNINSWSKGLKELFSGQGRLGRQQYLVVLLLVHVACTIVVQLALSQIGWFWKLILWLINGLDINITYTLVTAALLFASTKKRLHDVNWSTKSLILLFIPIVNFAFQFILLCVPGRKGPNQFGPDPLSPSQAQQ